MSMSHLDQSEPAGEFGDTLLTTHAGRHLGIRPATAADEPLLLAFFEHVTLEDLRFRFLSAVQHVGHEQIAAMLRIGDERCETFLAFDAEHEQLVAVGTLAADAAGQTAEIAISIHRDWKGLGIGWSLLGRAARMAKARGISCLQSIESRDNHAAIEVEREAGFTVRSYPGDPTLMLVEADLKRGRSPES